LTELVLPPSFAAYAFKIDVRSDLLAERAPELLARALAAGVRPATSVAIAASSEARRLIARPRGLMRDVLELDMLAIFQAAAKRRLTG